MKTFEKIYIGKGKQVGDLAIVKVTLKLEDLQALSFEFEGTKYVSFEVAQMINPDNFGRTHTCYYSKLVEKPAGAGQNQTSRRTRKSPAEA